MVFTVILHGNIYAMWAKNETAHAPSYCKHAERRVSAGVHAVAQLYVGNYGSSLLWFCGHTQYFMYYSSFVRFLRVNVRNGNSNEKEAFLRPSLRLVAEPFVLVDVPVSQSI